MDGYTNKWYAAPFADMAKDANKAIAKRMEDDPSYKQAVREEEIIAGLKAAAYLRKAISDLKARGYTVMTSTVVSGNSLIINFGHGNKDADLSVIADMALIADNTKACGKTGDKLLDVLMDHVAATEADVARAVVRAVPGVFSGSANAKSA